MSYEERWFRERNFSVENFVNSMNTERFFSLRRSMISFWRINKYNSLQYICVKLWTIYYQLFYFYIRWSALKKDTWSVRPCYTYASLLFKQKIIARDHRSRHSQTLCCIWIDGDDHYTNELLNTFFVRFRVILKEGDIISKENSLKVISLLKILQIQERPHGRWNVFLATESTLVLKTKIFSSQRSGSYQK